MPFEKSCRKGLSKAVSKHLRALNPVNCQLPVFHQSSHVVVHNIDMLCLILALGVSRQGKARFVVAKHLHLSDCFLG